MASVKRHAVHLEDEDKRPKKEKVSKNTLESDEEIGDDEEGGRMDEAELQVGQEPETIGFDSDIVITPFNMREELEEEGHFDASGTFIFKRTNDVGDNWLEDVDWNEVRRNEQAGGGGGGGPKATTIVEEEALPEVTADLQTELYHRAASLLRPGETVLRALRRLGPKRSATSTAQGRSWMRRKDGSTASAVKTLSPDDAANAEAFASLTELANDLLGSGDFDIYQKTKEVIEDLVASRTQNNEENELNALGAVIDDEAGIEPSRGETEEKQEGVTPATKWLVKRAKTAEADVRIEGPFEEAVLRQWLESTPSVDIFVKRQDVNEEFRRLSSIDFDKLKALFT
ncbi:CD2 antigen cytoplasmic tail-binding protein 2 -like protein [Echinococcus granulosus]|uniref:LIN1-like protein n=1 Tax=Echinococcus granulosus TaxID=6210 RepID=U6IZE1_ECHGR|nr:LIN1-like protein [Echinococcus granulosus]EUB64442.1 LIN1-like protein [Echinococcus granulosus]KAH9282433.1 CD2 antigen cytoplasmic tail-binding protein 2 -like protein [Echinococcus granulosus]CDS17185.1 lin1 protein [Echinococcus granulosus]